MIKQVKNKYDADKCDELLTKLVLDERQYNDTIDENIVIKNHFSKMLDNENIILLAYYIDDNIVGYILIRNTGKDTYLLDGLYVEEEFRNKGIANNLIKEAINRCQNLECKYIDINVMYKNDIAKHIYKNLGFNEFELHLRKKIKES